MFTSAGESLRLSGIDADINSNGRYRAVKPRVLGMDRATQADEIRQLLASPDVVVGSVAALTETGSLVIASGSGSQVPAYSGGAARVILIVGAQKPAINAGRAVLCWWHARIISVRTFVAKVSMAGVRTVMNAE